MKIEIKRNNLIIVPETDQDIAFIEDSLGMKENGSKVNIERVNDVALGFQSKDKFVLKLEKKND